MIVNTKLSKMNKPWVGYLSSVMLLFAGILMFAGGKPVIGVIFMVLAVVGLILKFYMNKKQGNNNDQHSQ